MSFPAYPSYRDSGDIALGDIPTHWAVTRVKDVVDIINGYPFDSKAFDAANGRPLLRIRDLGASDAEVRYRGEVPDGFEVTRRDVLIGMDGDFNVGRWMGSEPALLNQRVCALRTKSQVLSTLLEHALVAPLKRINALTYSTTVKHLSSYQVGSIKLALPSDENELSQLAAFLDRETAKIDALVEEQRRLIELLKEKREAVISHAVTKGLDPTVPLKDSGVEWLGQIPAHWEVKPLKYFVTFRSGGTPSKDNLDFWNGDVPWASAKDLKTDVLNDTIDHLTEAALEQGAAARIPAGSVLVLVRGMMLARTFPVCEVGAPMAINQDLKAVLPSQGISGSFLAWLLRGTSAETLNRLDEAGHGTKALRMDAWTSMRFPLPPESERVIIADYVSKMTEGVDALCEEASAAVTLLRERRAALISAAVTGKIDVRGAAAQQAQAA